MRFGHPRSSSSRDASIAPFEPSKVISPEVMRSLIDVERIEFLAQQLTTRASVVSGENFQIANVRHKGAVKFDGDERETQRRAEIVESLKSEGWISLMSGHVGKRMYAADCQVHQMRTGSDLPSHSHANEVFGILHFSRNYQGGRYYEVNGMEKVYPEIAPYSFVISKGGVEHGVETVTAGTRIVLVSVWARSEFKK